MQEASSHLDILPSLLLALVAAIPNHMLRYTALGLLCLRHAICRPSSLAVYAVPSTLFTWFVRQDEHERLAIKCRILNSEETIQLEKFRMLSNDIAGCAKRVRNIRTAVLLILEAEHQRKLAADIKETQFILAAIPLHL
ncbi:hypothetical protein B0H13DRAFT_1916044 [Mycena leptocephala]|nr:hypothetical protein B0H13DRAFT_1916044 [Mycena leptocephala]